jgi:prepilin-type N-terminal cleavage/methylation domain-containing protein
MTLDKNRPGQSGFTMIELLITMTVTLIGLAGLLAMTVSVAKGNRGASQSSEALSIGQATLEDLRAMPVTEIETGFGPVPIDAAMADVTGRANQVFHRQLLVTNIDLGADLILIQVVTSWTEEGAQQGAEGGKYDHAITLEVVRARAEVL